MARTGTDGPAGRAWPAAVVLGLALVPAYALALVYPMVLGPCPCRDPDGRPALVVATSRDLWVAVASKQWALLAVPALVAWSPRRERLRLAAVGLAVLARCTFEPVVHVYYLAPGLCLLLAYERVATGRRGRTALAGGLPVGWFAVHPGPALWWTAAAPLGGAQSR